MNTITLNFLSMSDANESKAPAAPGSADGEMVPIEGKDFRKRFAFSCDATTASPTPPSGVPMHLGADSIQVAPLVFMEFLAELRS
jgi:hypothetical protein